ncbi:MAG: anthranilate synthase component II [Bacteroidia bacterium]
MSLSVLLVDSRDSFTYNIVAACYKAHAQVEVIQREVFTAEKVEKFDALLLGPGAGHPQELWEAIKKAIIPDLRRPTLGICLGMQALAWGLGGEVKPTGKPAHGKKITIHHTQKDLWYNLPNPMSVGLYHSLHVSKLPDGFIPEAYDERGILMAFRARNVPLWGWQFHPDSILTPQGTLLVQNWIKVVTNVHMGIY